MGKDRSFPKFNIGDIVPGLGVGYLWKIRQHRRAQAQKEISSPAQAPTQEPEYTDAELAVIALRQRERKQELAEIAKDKVEIDPRAARLAKLCKAEGNWYLAGVFAPNSKPARSHGYASYGDVRGSNGYQTLGKQFVSDDFDQFVYAKAVQEAISDAQRTGALLQPIFSTEMGKGIKAANIKWAFYKDATEGYDCIGLQLSTVATYALDWGNDNRPNAPLTLSMRVPHQLAERVRHSHLTNPNFARSFMQQSFPEWIAQTNAEARGDVVGQPPKMQLTFYKDPVVTVKDQR